jgi:transposase
VWRAQIVLLSAEGLGTSAIMRETGESKTCVWRWQERFVAEGVDGLLRDKTRRSRIAKLDPSISQRVVALTMEEPPGETTHWTGAAMAKAVGASISSVQRIWRAHGLQPQRPAIQAVQRTLNSWQAARHRRVRPAARRLIVAIDRTSEFAFVELHEKVTRRTAADFLRRRGSLTRSTPSSPTTELTSQTPPAKPGPQKRRQSWSPSGFDIDHPGPDNSQLATKHLLHISRSGSQRLLAVFVSPRSATSMAPSSSRIPLMSQFSLAFLPT